MEDDSTEDCADLIHFAHQLSKIYSDLAETQEPLDLGEIDFESLYES